MKRIRVFSRNRPYTSEVSNRINIPIISTIKGSVKAKMLFCTEITAASGDNPRGPGEAAG